VTAHKHDLFIVIVARQKPSAVVAPGKGPAKQTALNRLLPRLERDALLLSDNWDSDPLGVGHHKPVPGESSAIAMALHRSGDLLLIDERYGTRVARDLGLTTIGTVGVLTAAVGKGLESLRTSLDALQATSFRGPDGLTDELFRMDESWR
jgi:hypothetical protein